MSARWLLGIVLLIWTLAPLYNMVLVAVQEKEDVFASNVWPPHPTLASFVAVFHESYWYLAQFLGADGQQPVHRRRGRAADAGDRLARRASPSCGCASGWAGC